MVTQSILVGVIIALELTDQLATPVPIRAWVPQQILDHSYNFNPEIEKAEVVVRDIKRDMIEQLDEAIKPAAFEFLSTMSDKVLESLLIGCYKYHNYSLLKPLILSAIGILS